jgi:hypothetical protein
LHDGKEIQKMIHQCGGNCPYRKDLGDAAAALASASRLFSESMMIDSDDLTENCYALVRAAKAKVQGARAAWVDHLEETAEAISPLGPSALISHMDRKTRQVFANVFEESSGKNHRIPRGEFQGTPA